MNQFHSNEMDLNLEKTRVGLKLPIQQMNSSIMSSQSDYDDESVIISVGGGPEDRNDGYSINCITRVQNYSQNREGKKTNAGKHVNNYLPSKTIDVKETMIKKPRLDDFKPTENFQSDKYTQLDNVKRSGKKIRFNETSKKSADLFYSSYPSDNIQPESYTSNSATLFSTAIDSGFAESCTDQKIVEVTTKNTKLDSLTIIEENKNTDQQENSESLDDEIESIDSNCSTHFSPFEDDDDDENAAKQEKSCNQLPTECTLLDYSAFQSSTLYFIRLFLNQVESEIQSLDLMNPLFSNEAKFMEVLDDFVLLAESNCAEHVQHCKTEVVKCLEKVYEGFLEHSKSGAPFEATRWSEGFSILQRFCDSKNICEEFIKFFTNHMMTPNNTTDLEDPQQIIEGLAEHETARFGLVQLHNALRKYSKFVKKRDSQSNIFSESFQQESSDFRRSIERKKNELDIELLRKFNEYRTKVSDDFLHLNYIATRNVMLLKSRKNS